MNFLDEYLKYKSQLFSSGKSAWEGHKIFAIWLMNTFKPDLTVELGVFHGDSFCAFCFGARLAGFQNYTQDIIGVDLWTTEEQQYPVPGGISRKDKYKLASYLEKNLSSVNYTLWEMSFKDALLSLGLTPIDLLHIDGCHTYEAVKEDYESYLPLVCENGIVLLHDTEVHYHPFGVDKFYDELEVPKINLVHSYGLGIVAPKGIPEELKFLFENEKEVQEYCKNIGEMK